jgi:selenobiotic family peptide radical SAM maturase
MDMRDSKKQGSKASGYQKELSRLRSAQAEVAGEARLLPREVGELMVNPTVRLLELSWKNLVPHLEGRDELPEPEKSEELVLIWLDPRTGKPSARVPHERDLLALKVVFEGIGAEAAAEAGNSSVGAIDRAIQRGVRQGIVLGPPSLIRRKALNAHYAEEKFEPYLSSSTFVLQWHITQACDLHCKHCYDRSDHVPMEPGQGIRVLDQLRGFCKERNVRGKVSFSGGNPLLYPRFMELYRAAAERGFETAILGNPTTEMKLDEIMRIQEPDFFQVSLEGLRGQNDEVRGPGHFDRTLAFLDLLRRKGIYSMVMLTLTRDNMGQVISLAELLRERVDAFNFNRLAMVGEGASLSLPERGGFMEFLEEYMHAAKESPIMGLKDNLINIIRHKRGVRPFGGCTGFGCGAAFNFIALLSDGEAHACRKFPSPIGNVYEQGLAGVYDSAAAEGYRAGPKACSGCSIRPVCGGCLAVAHGCGLDVLKERDPFCFMDELSQA